MVSPSKYIGITKKIVIVSECIPEEGKHLGLHWVCGVALWVWGEINYKMC